MASESAPTSGKEVDAVRNRIRANVLRIVKKTGHNHANMPWTEVVECMTLDMADALCADLPLTHATLASATACVA